MASAPYSWIVSELKGPEGQTLVASVNGASVVTAYLDANDPNQQWLLMSYLYDGAFQGLFYSVASDAYMSAPQDDGPVTVTNVIDGSSMWTAAASGNDFALRPWRNGNVNLNVAGEDNKEGATILAYHWGGGEANEVWDVAMYDTVARMAGANG